MADDVMHGRYLMVLPVPAFRTGPDTFEIEGAFAEHLRLLRHKLGRLVSELVIAAPELTVEAHARAAAGLLRIDENAERIRFHPMFRVDIGTRHYWLQLPKILRELYREVEQADVVHASNSQLYRPFEFPALVLGGLLGKKTISVTDIDHRQSAKMNLTTGRWSKKQYWVTRLVHDSFAHWQQEVGARFWSLVLLKGKQLAEDYGRGRSNVRHFLDSAFNLEHIISEARLESKRRTLRDSNHELRVIYFGRLAPYKGVDAMLRAVHHARQRGAKVRFDIIGGGVAESPLRELSRELGLDGIVHFVGMVPFGSELFERLYEAHVLLAAPLSEDTPRSALDACAAGLTLVAYDTYYYRELFEMGAPVELAPWLDFRALGNRLVDLDANRHRLADLLSTALEFARHNSQESWLDRRVGWTAELFGDDAEHLVGTRRGERRSTTEQAV